MTHRSPKNLNNPLRKLYKLELSMPAESKKNPACTCPRENAPKNQPNKLSPRISHIEIRVRDRASAQQPASAKKRGEGERVLSLSLSLPLRSFKKPVSRQTKGSCLRSRSGRTNPSPQRGAKRLVHILPPLLRLVSLSLSFSLPALLFLDDEGDLGGRSLASRGRRKKGSTYICMCACMSDPLARGVRDRDEG